MDRVEDRHRIEPGNLLFAWSGTKGISFGARIWNGPIGVLNQHIFKVLPDTRKITSSYAWLVLRNVQDNIEQHAHGFKASFVHVRKSDLINVLLPVPTNKAEQETIVEALSDADALIEALEQLIAKKRAIKQGAMQELLTGKTRLPGFGSRWRTAALADIADIRSGGTPSTTESEFWDGSIRWCTPTDITALDGYKYLSDTERKITPLGLKASAAELIPPNSIVMTSRATIGECAINSCEVATNQGFKNLIPHPDTDVEFLYYLMTTQKMALTNLCGGSTFLEIGKTQLAACRIKVPQDKAEQFAIASILSDMDAEITALESKLTKARAIKQGMMQELLTGRVRLI